MIRLLIALALLTLTVVMADDIENVRDRLHVIQGRTISSAKIPLNDLTPSDHLRSSKSHFPSVLGWMTSYPDPSHILLTVVKDGDGDWRVVDGRARLAACKELYDGNTMIECTVYAGSILEYCVVQSFGAVASSALNIAEKVELVVNLMRILRVKSGNPSTISAILSEVCENAEFTNRICRLSLVHDKMNRKTICAAFGDDKIIHTELYRAILTGYNTNKRKCVDIISNHSGIRSELIKALNGGGSKLVRCLTKKGYSGEAAAEIEEEVADIPTAVELINSGPRSVRIRNDEDASLPLAADLIMNIRNAFETEFSSTMGRLLHETDEVIAPVYIIQGDKNHQLEVANAINDLIARNEPLAYCLLVREKNEIAIEIPDAVALTLQTEDRENKDGVRVKSVEIAIIRMKYGIVSNAKEINDELLQYGIPTDLSSSELIRLIGKDIDIQSHNVSHGPTKGLLTEILPFIGKIYYMDNQINDYRELLRENYKMIARDLRCPSIAGRKRALPVP